MPSSQRPLVIAGGVEGVGSLLAEWGRLCSMGNPGFLHNWVSERSYRIWASRQFGGEFKEIGLCSGMDAARKCGKFSGVSS